MSRKILFRADGNAKTGLGHLYRLLALAEMLKEHFEITFITRKDTQNSVISTEFKRVTIPTSIEVCNEVNWLLSNFPSDAIESIVLDGYQFNPDYQKKLKSVGYKLAYIDDFAQDHMYGDIVINHAPQIKEQDYNKEPYTNLALGTKYALLRPSFLEAAKQQRAISKIENVYVSFGGADPNDLTYTTLKSLLKIPEVKEINVVVGAAYKHQKILALTKAYDHLKIHKNVTEKDICKLLYKSHFAIVPSSTTLYEVCAVKMPVLSGYYVDNQKDIYAGMLAQNVLFDAGDFNKLSEGELTQKVVDILRLKDYSDYCNNQAKLFDKKIKKRFLSLFLGVRYQPATKDDLMLFYNWANDPITRANSYVSDPIDLDTHKKWYTSKLQQENSLFFVARIGEAAVGMLRFDIAEDHALIGISIDKEYRGMGLATRLLIDIQEIYFNDYKMPIVALIKQSNIGSIKAFKRAGFVQFSEKTINDVPSFEYRLSKPQY